MVQGFKALLFVTVTAIYAISCVRGDNPISRADNPRNSGGNELLGAGWSKVSVPGNCVDVFFVNDTAGYLAGAGVYRSMDGGLNWTKTNAPDNNYYNLFFLNDKYGWAVTGTSIAKTVDSGKTWQTHATANLAISDVFFLDENNGFAVAPQGVLKSTDGGASWSLLPGSPTEGYNLYFRDASNGFFGTDTKGLYKTTDGGATFSKVSGVPASVFNIQFLNTDPLQGFTMAVPDPQVLLGDLYKTTDGGTTWTKSVTLSDNYFDFHFKDANNGFVMTANMVYKIDGSSATKVLYFPISSNRVRFVECHFTDDLDRGWVIYNGGTLFRYVKP